MQKLLKIAMITYLVIATVFAVLLPLSAIFLIVKLCGASAMSWLGCCVPLIITLALSPFFLLAKKIVDGGAEK